MRITLLSALALAVAPAFGEAAPTAPKAKEMLVYVGTYAKENTPGIYIYRMNMDSGELTPAGTVSGLANPTFLAVHPSGKYMYAANELDGYKGSKGGAITSFEATIRHHPTRFRPLRHHKTQRR